MTAPNRPRSGILLYARSRIAIAIPLSQANVKCRFSALGLCNFVSGRLTNDAAYNQLYFFLFTGRQEYNRAAGSLLVAVYQGSSSLRVGGEQLRKTRWETSGSSFFSSLAPNYRSRASNRLQFTVITPFSFISLFSHF